MLKQGEVLPPAHVPLAASSSTLCQQLVECLLSSTSQVWTLEWCFGVYTTVSLEMAHIWFCLARRASYFNDSFRISMEVKILSQPQQACRYLSSDHPNIFRMPNVNDKLIFLANQLLTFLTRWHIHETYLSGIITKNYTTLTIKNEMKGYFRYVAYKNDPKYNGKTWIIKIKI